MSTRTGLSFECDQDWSSMRATACGRFCDVCRKEVFDLTNKTAAEIKSLQKEKGEICGMLLTEQVEDVVPLHIPLAGRVRYWLATAVTFLGIEAAQAATVEKPVVQTEIVAGDALEEAIIKPDPTGRDSRKKKPIKLFKKKANKSDDAKVKRKKKIYVSKRFPFIHFKKRRFVGRVKF